MQCDVTRCIICKSNEVEIPTKNTVTKNLQRSYIVSLSYLSMQ